MKNIIEYYPDDYCRGCDAPNSLLLVFKNGDRVPLREVTEEMLDSNESMGIFCTNCKKSFMISFSIFNNRRFPRQITDQFNIDSFIRRNGHNIKNIEY